MANLKATFIAAGAVRGARLLIAASAAYQRAESDTIDDVPAHVGP